MAMNEIEKFINTFCMGGDKTPMRRKLRALVRKSNKLGSDYGEWGSDHQEHNEKFKKMFGFKP